MISPWLAAKVLVDGVERGRAGAEQQAFARCSAYVPQDDHFPPVMTAAEVMGFRAALVLPRGMSPVARVRRVHEVLAAMGLARHAKTLVRA